jgi:ribonuclease D
MVLRFTLSARCTIMPSSLSPTTQTYIQTAAELQDILPILSLQEHLCLDTEFHAENRYTPKLMLIQIADLHRNTWIIDPLNVDITPLATILQEKTLIMHGAKEDLQILQRQLCILPTKLIDTQIAAAMVGIYYPTRLSRIIEHCLNITEPQHQTLTDWSKRPLSESQIKYAAEDASTLCPLFSFFQETLKEKMVLLSHICTEFAEEVLNPEPKKQLDWLQWGVTKTLSPTSVNILAQLIEWRNYQAQKKNKPVNYVLPRAVAIDIARRQPSSIQILKQNRRINSILIKRHGNELLECIQKGKDSSLHYVPYSTDELRLAQAIRTWAQAMAQLHSIDANLLIPEHTSLQIAREGSAALKGWRKILLESTLEPFLKGETRLYLQNGSIQLHP